MDEKMKPCPFCGGTLLSVQGSLIRFVFCHTCEAEGPAGDNDDEVIEAWNRRENNDN